MNSLIYTGVVEHTRLQPVRHQFGYSLYFYGLDLDELADLDRRLPLFGHNRFRPASLHDTDYLDARPGTIRERLSRYLQERDCGDGIARVMLITSPRYFNYVFNPVSFHYCLSAEDQLVCVVAEVNNTFGERHLYVLKEREGRAPGFVARYTARKAFHVSPFHSMEGDYEFLFSDFRKELDIRVNLRRDGEPVFQARLAGRPQPLTAKNQLLTLLKHPALPHLTVPRIIWQAAKLHYQRDLPVYHKPIPRSVMTIRRLSPTVLQKRCMKTILGLFQQIEKGRLRVTLPDGQVRIYGNASAPLEAELAVNDYRFFSRTVLEGDIGFGDAYVVGEWDSPDATRVLELMIENQEVLANGDLATAWLSRAVNRLNHLARKNTLPGARKNIGRHYDLNDDFFRTFLDPSMTYSCGLWNSPEEDLEQAQYNKVHSIIRKARIREGDHVLEIGCGWGGFAVEAVKRTGCRVTGITVSETQYQFARRRVRAEGLEDRIEILLTDYRHVAGRYDRIVSIEMLEAVGHDYFGTFFARCDRLLNPDGLVVLQTITIPDQRYETYRKGCDWIQKHIFPGGLLPCLNVLCEAMTRQSRFVVEDLENIGPHYARTLREWRKRFLQHSDILAGMGFDRTFQRKWVYYLSYCEAGFATRTLGDLQLVLTRPFNRNLPLGR